MNLAAAARKLVLTSPLLAASNVASFSVRHGRRVTVPSALSTGRFVGSATVTTTTSARSFTSTPTALQMANVLKLSDPQSELLDQVDVFIFDCDGVIWRGDSLIDGIPETLDKLRKAGKKMFFVTNNSTKSRAGYKKKFDSLGLNVPAEEIFSSSFAAAAYLEQSKFPTDGSKKSLHHWRSRNWRRTRFDRHPLHRWAGR